MLCETCLGDNPYVRMVTLAFPLSLPFLAAAADADPFFFFSLLPFKTKQNYGKECKVPSSLTLLSSSVLQDTRTGNWGNWENGLRKLKYENVKMVDVQPSVHDLPLAAGSWDAVQKD